MTNLKPSKFNGFSLAVESDDNRICGDIATCTFAVDDRVSGALYWAASKPAEDQCAIISRIIAKQNPLIEGRSEWTDRRQAKINGQLVAIQITITLYVDVPGYDLTEGVRKIANGAFGNQDQLRKDLPEFSEIIVTQ